MMRNPDPVLGEMPFMIKKNIAEYVGALDRVYLRRMDTGFKCAIAKIHAKFNCVKICLMAGRVEVKIAGNTSPLEFTVSWVKTISGTEVLFMSNGGRTREITEKNVHFVEKAVAEIESLLNYKKVDINHFSINNLCCDKTDRDDFYERLSLMFAKRTDKISTKYFFMCINDVPSAERILNRLDPETLECLKLPLITGSEHSREPLTMLAESGLFRTAKEVYVEQINAVLPMESWWNKTHVSINVGLVTTDFLCRLKTHLLSSENFARFEVFHLIHRAQTVLNAFNQISADDVVNRPNGGRCRISVGFGRLVFSCERSRSGHSFQII